MKHIAIIVIFLLLSTILVACDASKLPIQEYEGKDIVELTYVSIDYNGGISNTYKIDFTENEILHNWNVGQSTDTLKYTKINEFDEEKEKNFIDTIYSYGLFSIRKRYKKIGIIDGGGWNLEIKYADGSVKNSSGSNAGPYSVFRRCSVPFYELCGKEVFGGIPEDYPKLPNVNVRFEKGEETISFFNIQRADCYWNEGKIVCNNVNYFALHSAQEYYGFSDEAEITATFNIQPSKYKGELIKFIVRKFDYNEDLTNEQTVLESGYFSDRKTIVLEPNKIYLYELHFVNGEYVIYTFNTKCSTEQYNVTQ